jgi:hypothetical protein
MGNERERKKSLDLSSCNVLCMYPIYISVDLRDKRIIPPFDYQIFLVF